MREKAMEEMEKVMIREAGPEDIPVMAEIQTESWKTTFQGMISKEDMLRYTDPEYVAQVYRKMLEKSDTHVLLEYVDREPHCVAAWGLNRSGWPDSVAELKVIHSLQDKRHRGYGSAMIERIFSEMRQAGYTEAVVWTYAANTAARAFYEKHGFILTQQTRSGNGADEVMLGCRL